MHEYNPIAPKPHQGRRIVVGVLAGVATAALASGCGDTPGPLAYKQELLLKEGQPVYPGTATDKSACGYVVGAHALRSVDTFNAAMPQLAQPQFAAADIAPLLNPGHTCPTGKDEYVWVRMWEGPSPTPPQS